MPDTPVECGQSEPHRPSLEARVAVMEAAIPRIEDGIGRILATLDGLKAQLADQGAQIAELRGSVKQMPSTWQMMIGIIGGQVALAGLIAAVVFGALRLTGHS